MNFFNMLLEGTGKPVPDWISKSFPIIQTVIIIIIAIAAVAVIVAVMMQPSNTNEGNNVITGTNDSYFAHNKSNNKEGRLKKLIVTCAIVIFVLTVIYFISFGIYNGFSA